jgi:hypothetical protein
VNKMEKRPRSSKSASVKTAKKNASLKKGRSA